jgi:hypothetical protein
MNKPTECNVTIWRMQNGKVFSCCVAVLEQGKITRLNGVSCHPLQGLPEFHDWAVKHLSSFGGEPVEVFVSNGTKGFVAAIREDMTKAWGRQFQRPLASVIG